MGFQLALHLKTFPIIGFVQSVASAKIIESGIDISDNKDALLGDENVLRETFLSRIN